MICEIRRGVFLLSSQASSKYIKNNDRYLTFDSQTNELQEHQVHLKVEKYSSTAYALNMSENTMLYTCHFGKEHLISGCFTNHVDQKCIKEVKFTSNTELTTVAYNPNLICVRQYAFVNKKRVYQKALVWQIGTIKELYVFMMCQGMDLD